MTYVEGIPSHWACHVLRVALAFAGPVLVAWWCSP